jgi:hypothetical protein
MPVSRRLVKNDVSKKNSLSHIIGCSSEEFVAIAERSLHLLGYNCIADQRRYESMLTENSLPPNFAVNYQRARIYFCRAIFQLSSA